MTNPARDHNQRLEPLIGEWSLTMVLPAHDAAGETAGRVTFHWMGDKAFVVERWTVPIPEAPDGLAILGWDEGGDTFLQHYFDERGVARVYEMTFDGHVWTLERIKPDFSPFEFSQRFTGTLTEDGNRIDGTWEIAEDHTTWQKDFDLVYTRVAS
jgi:hypothetical protein